jgi:hypothetical protein
MIYHGDIAQYYLDKNLEDSDFLKCKGYYIEEDLVIAFDNSTGHCNVEEFETQELAICWLENYFEMSEIDEFNIVKIEEDVYFLPSIGHIKINFLQEYISTQFFPA